MAFEENEISHERIPANRIELIPEFTNARDPILAFNVFQSQQVLRNYEGPLCKQRNETVCSLVCSINAPDPNVSWTMHELECRRSTIIETAF